MGGILWLASLGGVWIAVAGVALIVTTLIEGALRGYRRFLGITIVCAVAVIVVFLWMCVSLYMSDKSS